ncbi:hypothetical protein CVT25_014694 [Psilocybe cyanescens]|uniref:Uncharacterized protein n=1 Tax=Psilocybe cyanescens TaxID=93625 RepID=A0A409XBI1_PSICY|nr:hypothetical protein CVT25_014694 [Psilocybe cyanescens]
MAQGPAILFNINSGGMADSTAELNGIPQNGTENGTINGLKNLILFSAILGNGNNVTCVTFGCHVGPLVTPTTPPLSVTTTTLLPPSWSQALANPTRHALQHHRPMTGLCTMTTTPDTHTQYDSNDDGSVYDNNNTGPRGNEVERGEGMQAGNETM